MKNRSLSKITHYIILCFVLSILVFLLIFFNGNPKIQKNIVIIASTWYVVWGYYHHTRERTIDLSVIVEYLVYGILGGSLIIGILE